MKKVTNVEAGEVFAKLIAGKDVYCVFADYDQLLNLSYESVGAVKARLENKDCAFFIVEEEAEA
jgi:hypothetical protein